MTPSGVPTRSIIDGTSRGEEVSVKTTFANGQASSEISVAGTPSTKVDQVAGDTIVLPNAFFGSYAALGRRLVGKSAGNDIPRLYRPTGRGSDTARRGVSGADRNREAGDRGHALCPDRLESRRRPSSSASGQMPTERCCE